MKLDNKVTTHMVLKYNKKINKKKDRGQNVSNNIMKSFCDYLDLVKSKTEIKTVENEDTQTESLLLASTPDTGSV